MFTRRKRNAFTLIELLVVIAIIAILAAILFPVFAKARERAKMSACLSNTQQIGKALSLYIDDNDERLIFNPYAMSGYANVATDKQPNFIISLARYTSSREVWACPSVTLRPGVPGKNGYWVSGDYPLDTTLYKNVGYGFNEVMVSIGGDPTMRRKGPAALKDLRNPAGIAIFGDGNSMYASYQTWVRNGAFIENGAISATNVPAPGELYWSWSSPNQTSANPWAYGQTRHMGGSTFVYADGHAAYSKPSVLNPTYNDPGNAYKYGYYPKAALY